MLYHATINPNNFVSKRAVVAAAAAWLRGRRR
jgi:hypothetical protein